MTNVQEQTRPEAVPLPALPKPQLALLSLGMAGLLPLAAAYLVDLMHIEYYQFAPFVIVAAVLLIMQRWPRSAWDLETFACLAHTTKGVGGAILCCTSGLTLGLAAAWFFSPWLGFLAFIIAGAGCIWLLTGKGFKFLVGPWMLLLTALRPPLGLDEQLIQWLQLKTAMLADHTLDMLGVEHFRQGVLIELPGRLMFVEEACSGIQSLFSMLALAALLIVWERRPVLWSGLLMIGAIGGSVIMNLVRVLCVVLAADQYQLDLFKEPLHTILGVGVFVFALLWLWCCDLWLAFWFGPVRQEEADSRMAHLMLHGWNRLIAGQLQYFAEPDDLSVSRSPPLARWRTLNAVYSGCASIAVCLLCLASAGDASSSAPIWPSNETFVAKLRALSAESMPAQLAGLPLKRYETQHRPHFSDFGQHSQVWTYKDAGQAVVAAVDYPFTGWHDLRICYQAIGWTVGDVQRISDDGQTGSRLEIELHKPSGETGFLLFGFLQESAAESPIPFELQGFDRLESRLTFSPKEVPELAGWTAQVQVFTSGFGGIDQQERELLRESYVEVRSRVAEALQVKN